MSEHIPPLRLFAAGSLRAALTEIVSTQPGGHPSRELVFGPAGLLRERIEEGDVPDMFLSANMEHPAALAATRPEAVVSPFARNALVALARRELELTTANFLDRLLLEGTRIGTSTPLADPSGDYAQQLFSRADGVRPGAGAILASRARHLVGGRESAPLPVGRYPAQEFLASGQVDVFLTYLSNALTMANEFDVVTPPDELSIKAVYGLVVLATAASRHMEATALATDILSMRGQEILQRHGFAGL